MIMSFASQLGCCRMEVAFLDSVQQFHNAWSGAMFLHVPGAALVLCGTVGCLQFAKVKILEIRSSLVREFGRATRQVEGVPLFAEV